MSALLSSLIAVFLLFLGQIWGQTRNSVREALNVAAASDLSVVGPELQKSFEKKHLDVAIRLVNGASAMLAQQIEHGAPFDLFLSANAQYVEGLAEHGKIEPKSVKSYATGRLGVVWRDGGHHALRDLTAPYIKVVALPNPKLAPYGVAAQEALEYGGLWLRVQPKVVYGENVRQALQFLESGNADAVITSDALLQGKIADVIPGDWHKPIVQKGGVVASSKEKAAAGRFLDFLVSAEGQAILAKFGFGPPS